MLYLQQILPIWLHKFFVGFFFFVCFGLLFFFKFILLIIIIIIIIYHYNFDLGVGQVQSGCKHSLKNIFIPKVLQRFVRWSNF